MTEHILRSFRTPRLVNFEYPFTTDGAQKEARHKVQFQNSAAFIATRPTADRDSSQRANPSEQLGQGKRFDQVVRVPPRSIPRTRSFHAISGPRHKSTGRVDVPLLRVLQMSSHLRPGSIRIEDDRSNTSRVGASELRRRRSGRDHDLVMFRPASLTPESAPSFRSSFDDQDTHVCTMFI